MGTPQHDDLALEEGFSSAQVMALTGIGYRRLDHWAKTDFLAPSIAQASGHGTDRRYSFTDLVAIKTALRLRDTGISLQALRKMVERIRSRQGHASNTAALAGTYLVSDGRDVFEKNREQLWSLLDAPDQGVLFFVNLGTLCGELEAAIRKAA